METFIGVLILVAGVAVVAWMAGRGHRESAAAATPPPAAGPLATADLVYQLNNFYTNVVTVPDDLAQEPMFQELVNRYAELPNEALLALVEGSLAVPACAALRVLERRRDGFDAVTPILEILPDVSPYTRAFALPVLDARSQGPVLGKLLARTDRSWQDGILLDALRRFIQARLAAGESIEALAELDPKDEAHAHLEILLRRLGPPAEVLAKAWRGGGSDLSDQDHPAPRAAVDPPILHEALQQAVELLLRMVVSPQGQSALLVGDPLVGKSAVLRVFAERVRDQGWSVLERSATELVADQSFVGQVEGRVKELVQSLQDARTVWIVPDFVELVYAGRHSQSPVGVLEMLLPHMESGRLRLVGEVRPAACDRLLQNVPRLRSVIETLRLRALGDEASLDLARTWSQTHGDLAGDSVLREALQLAKHYLRDGSLPGSMLQLLQRSRQRLLAEDGPRPLAIPDLLATLSERTGIPVSFLDEGHELDLGQLREFFAARIMGQEEAVQCLVDRVALLKAGLADPHRPAGVLLFVGPTGTGKTAVVKALAEFLFGTPERMVRLDMSEFQSEESISRLVGTGGTRDSELGQSLAQTIASQPFSVVLLDEFEKAHPRIWDLFLQVFDDGRLTDRWGRTSDFRHAIIILTSNLGASAARGAVIGFAAKGPTASASAVERALEGTFRPEFLNRIDRIVVFRPLHRAVMRRVLEKELRAALRLRGLRNREWAVEWDESAVEFLLDRGFSPELGARPLKRAIERHFLAPLAETIVSRNYPEGDQFLFVHADGEKLIAEFIDPELPSPPQSEAIAAPAAAAAETSLRRLARDGGGSGSDLAFLEGRFRALEAGVAGPAWGQRKAAGFAAMCAVEFWSSPDRFQVLSLTEYIDRIEAGVRRAGSILGRLAGSRSGRPPVDLVQRLAHQIYLLEAACAGLEAGQLGDAFLLVEAGRDSQTPAEAHDAFATELGRMYQAWARARGMRWKVLEERAGGDHQAYQILLEVSGFGAVHLLAPEAGMHQLDNEDAPRLRARAYVLVAAQPGAPAEPSAGSVLASLRAGLDGGQHRTVVRRYRREPSPLVRDAVRGWRSGRLNQVLSGDFDLMD